MMIEKKDYSGENKKGWIVYAVLSAIFAAATSILAKIGIDGVESNLGTALRTIVVLAMAWAVVFVKGKQKEVKNIDKKEYQILKNFHNFSKKQTSKEYITLLKIDKGALSSDT